MVQALRMGLYVETACALAGIHKETYYEWLRQAKREQDVEDSKFVIFSDAVEKAQAEAEGSFLKTIIEDDSWQSKAWILERKFRQRWGRHLTDDPVDPQVMAEQIMAYLDEMRQVTLGGFPPAPALERVNPNGNGHVPDETDNGP
jgi:transposase-like protein